MPIQKEIWLDHFVQDLFPDNSFLSKSFNADEFVRAGKVVHIPCSGAKIKASVGPIARPKVASEKVDQEVQFSLSEFYTDPIYIPNADKYELSYDKRATVLSAARGALDDVIATEILKAWTKSSGTTFSKAPKVTRKIVREIQREFNLKNIPQEDRYILLSAEAYDQLLEDLTEAQSNAFLASADAANGIVGKLYGFNVMMRSKILDNKYAVAWHKNYVCCAKGECEMFVHENDPLYYADVLSFLVRAGGSTMRNDGLGVYSINKDNTPNT